METDCHLHSITCHKCQIYADKVHVPLVPLNVLTTPWPFAMWGIDMIGEIKPIASNRHPFILHNLICRYGITERIIVIGGSGTDCLTLVSRNVAEARVATVFYFLQHGQDKSTTKFLMRLSLGSGGRFIERERVSTLSIHGYPWALRYLLICVFKTVCLFFNCLSKCPSKYGKVLKRFLLREKLVAFDVEGVFSSKMFLDEDVRWFRVEQFEIQAFGGKTVSSGYQVQRAKIWGVEH
ncbi:unnamed protein product [Vicia faba]|uniref:Uncharacterized protein n=1 Tax=Vicia faba TaxID=3906 RepID=A0AAV1AC04_VICFA|nr:unnamed protein product [Vicia faba]